MNRDEGGPRQQSDEENNLSDCGAAHMPFPGSGPWSVETGVPENCLRAVEDLHSLKFTL